MLLNILFFLLAIPVGLYAGLPHQNPDPLQAAALDSLSLDIYTTWTPDGPIPQVFSVTSDEHMDVMLVDQSDRTWLVQNEPERLGSDNGSGTSPAVVAAALQGVEQSYACCGTVVDEQGIQWLDEYLAAGGPIPDAWHVHIYQTWGGGWTYAANRFKSWMETNGVERPVIVSETSAAHAPLSMQMEVMQVAFDTMKANDWLTTVLWFSVYHSSVEPSWQNAQLVYDNGERTILGDMFVRLRGQLAADEEPTPTNTPEPTPTNTPEPTATPLPPTETPQPEPTTTSTPETTETPNATETPSPEPTVTSSPEATTTVAPEPTATPSPEPASTESPEATITATAEPTTTASPEPTVTASPEPAVTVNPEPSATTSPEPSATPSPEAVTAPEATRAPASPTVPPVPQTEGPTGGSPDSIPQDPSQSGLRRIFLPTLANVKGN